jgi:hypothetical protein
MFLQNESKISEWKENVNHYGGKGRVDDLLSPFSRDN